MYVSCSSGVGCVCYVSSPTGVVSVRAVIAGDHVSVEICRLANGCTTSSVASCTLLVFLGVLNIPFTIRACACLLE